VLSSVIANFCTSQYFALPPVFLNKSTPVLTTRHRPPAYSRSLSTDLYIGLRWSEVLLGIESIEQFRWAQCCWDATPKHPVTTAEQKLTIGYKYIVGAYSRSHRKSEQIKNCQANFAYDQVIAQKLFLYTSEHIITCTVFIRPYFFKSITLHPNLQILSNLSRYWVAGILPADLQTVRLQNTVKCHNCWP